MKKNNYKYWFSAVGVTVIIFAATLLYFSRDNVALAPGVQKEIIEEPTREEPEIVAEKPKPLPEKYLLQVQFQSQAPYRNWAQPYQDACEEASIVMVKYFLENKELTTAMMKSEIEESVAWQIANYGGHHDLNAVNTLKLAEQYFDMTGEVISNYSLEDIEQYISNGTPVLAPSAGRLLGNPGYTSPGPIYHMLVVIGYDDSRGVFITNDPGVNHGANFEYKYQTVLDAVSGPKTDMVKEILILDK